MIPIDSGGVEMSSGWSNVDGGAPVSILGLASPRSSGGPTGVEIAADLADFVDEDCKRLYPKLQDQAKFVLERFLSIVLCHT